MITAGAEAAGEAFARSEKQNKNTFSNVCFLYADDDNDKCLEQTIKWVKLVNFSSLLFSPLYFQLLWLITDEATTWMLRFAGLLLFHQKFRFTFCCVITLRVNTDRICPVMRHTNFMVQFLFYYCFHMFGGCYFFVWRSLSTITTATSTTSGPGKSRRAMSH